ncbi:DUF1957 domain-containing protein [bacterium]|nr:DUF1957 domain-containing protein [bacterium]
MRPVDFCLVLHAHLPYVRHPEVEEHGFEWWFYEACWEVYGPLLRMFERLEHDSVPFRMTISISPPLLAMFSDQLLSERLERHLKRLAVLTEKERERTQNTHFAAAAAHFYYRVRDALDVYRRYQGNLAAGFRHWQDAGRIEVITAPATHGFLPLLQSSPECAAAQVRVGAKSHEKFFGSKPAGMWLSECAYMPAHDGQPGVDDLLADAGIRYFFLESHGVTGATPRPPRGVAAPVLCPSGVVAFGRDPETSKQVWSATEGYPGDAWYCEHHKDAGYFLSAEQIKPFRPDRTGRIPIGLKYFRVTSKSSGQKKAYEPHMALRRAAYHASHFIGKRAAQAYGLQKFSGNDWPVIVAPYDAELFGHWWHEGPKFLEYVFRKAHERPGRLPFRFAVPSDRLKYPVWHRAVPAASSWGDGGYFKVWLNGTNDELLPLIESANAAMVRAVRDHSGTKSEVRRRALEQMGRQLLLAQSSDWPFIATTSGGIREYAKDKAKKFLKRFWGLYRAVRKGEVSSRALDTLEQDDNIFPWLTIGAWKPVAAPAGNPDGAMDPLRADLLGVKPVEPFLGFVWWDFSALSKKIGKSKLSLTVKCLTPPLFEKSIPSNAPSGRWYLHQIRPGSRYQMEARLEPGGDLLAVSVPALLPGRTRPKKWTFFKGEREKGR